eukprot:369567_1
MNIICTSILLLVILPIIIESTPINDRPCDASAIHATDLPLCISTTTFGAGFEGVTPVLDGAVDGLDCTTEDDMGASTGGSIWFRVIGPVKDLSVSTCGGASWDTKISVFEPPTVCNDYTSPSFICVGGNDDGCGPGPPGESSVTISGTHSELYVHLHGVGDAEGDAKIFFSAADTGPATYCVDQSTFSTLTSEPTTSIPTTSIPTTNIPTTSIPTTHIPTTSIPTTNIPTTFNPTTSEPTTPSPTTDSDDDDDDDDDDD